MVSKEQGSLSHVRCSWCLHQPHAVRVVFRKAIPFLASESARLEAFEHYFYDRVIVTMGKLYVNSSPANCHSSIAKSTWLLPLKFAGRLFEI